MQRRPKRRPKTEKVEPTVKERKKADTAESRKRKLETLKPDPDLPRGYLSVSSADTFLRCGHQWALRYVMGIKTPPGIALVEGSSHHFWLEQQNKHRKKTKGDNLKVPEAVDILEDELTKRSKEITKEGWEGQDKDIVMTRGEVLVKTYLEGEIARDLQPAGIEQKFEIMLGGVPVLGFMDVTEDNNGKISVWDYKVVGRMKSVSDIKNGIQLPVYGNALSSGSGGFICLNKKNLKVAQIRGPIPQRQKAWTKELFRSVAESIKAGIFLKAQPDQWWCSERFCGYWSVCRGAKRVADRIKVS